MSEMVDDIKQDIGHMLLSTSHDIKKHLRRKRIYIAIILSFVVPLLLGLVPKLAGTGHQENPEDFIKDGLGFVSLLVVIVVAFFAGDTISGEFETRTCYSIFSTPQRRHSIFLGKHLSSLLISMGMVSVYYVVVYAQVLAIYGTGSTTMEFFISYILALLFTAGAVGLAVFFSSIMSSGMQSTLVTFFMLFLVFDLVGFVLMIAGIEPWFLITYHGGLIVNVYGAAPLEIPGFITMTIPKYEQGVWVMAGYAMILPFIGIFIASRREVK